ncbi:hypothetical protein P691DRAFT_730309 [Macrolepiota fuliginosa MF-IS2]|uniref:NACHT domain-containing protein n=1 Tax=Macrolepiota fuliginosa MF-IS2 TaxID=1400762 RepID=A0A9P5XB49_9AGAR|nr:hypothetical protein P691DRAFT_730309 [Macrolepiota fuliginosa MF-IS2]
MIEQVQTQNIQLLNSSFDVLEILSKHSISGVEFDSSMRSSATRCHPGTRQSILQDIWYWLGDNQHVDRLLWLHGPAGAGKSTIIQTLAEDAESSDRLAASLFFSDSTTSGDENFIVATICYQIAVKISCYRDFLAERMRANPRILEKRLREQFNELIVRFFKENPNTELGSVRIILLDGLDELASLRHGDQSTMEQLLALIVHLHTITSAPFLWVISSRGEHSIRRALSTSQTGFTEWLVPADSVDDVTLYIQDSFSVIRQKYPNLIHPDWPSDGEVSMITTAAGGLFIYASTAIRFIDDPRRKNPITQFAHLLSLLDTTQANQLIDKVENPFLPLDRLYTRIMVHIHHSVLPDTLQLLGYALFKQDTMNAWTLVSASNVLAYERHTAYSALEQLGAVLEIPNVDQAEDKNFRIFHSSFAEYLLSPVRSGDFVLDMDKANTHVWWCYLRILQDANDTGPSMHIHSLYPIQFRSLLPRRTLAATCKHQPDLDPW